MSMEEYFADYLKKYLDPIISASIQREFDKYFLKLSISMEEQDIIFMDEACRITGLARQTIYQLVGTNEIPYLPKGGRKKLAFSRKALLAWMEGKK
jgi:excisionase family DNA binding protein